MGWPYGIERVCSSYRDHLNQWTDPRYIFREHFLLAGPKSNPAGLPSSSDPHPHVSNDAVYAMFKTISEGKAGVKFLTRNDKSATNVLEREIFKVAMGRYPEVGVDKWYIPLTGDKHYPDTALEVSNEKGYYTLSDRGIWTWADPSKKSNLKIFCEAGNTNPEDVLLNPCLAIARIGDSWNARIAKEFVEWLSTDGQAYVATYVLHGDELYSKAPEDNIFACLLKA
ncbi:MAG: hypothetical protein ACFB10_26405 [Salibacteraceae bacterium]